VLVRPAREEAQRVLGECSAFGHQDYRALSSTSQRVNGPQLNYSKITARWRRTALGPKRREVSEARRSASAVDFKGGAFSQLGDQRRAKLTMTRGRSLLSRRSSVCVNHDRCVSHPARDPKDANEEVPEDRRQGLHPLTRRDLHQPTSDVVPLSAKLQEAVTPRIRRRPNGRTDCWPRRCAAGALVRIPEAGEQTLVVETGSVRIIVWRHQTECTTKGRDPTARNGLLPPVRGDRERHEYRRRWWPAPSGDRCSAPMSTEPPSVAGEKASTIRCPVCGKSVPPG
jgi:hypothetical protein